MNMIVYAKISDMLRYSEEKIWPLDKDYNNLKFVLRDIAKLLLKRGTIKRYPDNKLYVFSLGTRGWEYPWVLEQLKELPRGSRILDAGCGESGFSEVLYTKGFIPTGLDFFQKSRPQKKGYGISDLYIKKVGDKVKLVNGSLNNIPFPDNTFDAITCISVMEHIVISNKNNPDYHKKCLDEMKRVLRAGGLLICTYDTFLNKKVVYGGTKEWGEDGWNYLSDTKYLSMKLKSDNSSIITLEHILNDEDTFFIPPDRYFSSSYGSGFNEFGRYHRMTSVGFVLVK